MKTLKTIAINLSLISLVVIFTSCNETKTNPKKDEVIENPNQMMIHSKMENDTRISLNLQPKKAQHQLMNMRNHLAAVQSILNYLSKDDFEKASEVASSKLGLTEEMRVMCSSFGNEKFKNLGLEFHNNADKMSEVFKNKNKNESLEALSVTIKSCVTCHASFKQ